MMVLNLGFSQSQEIAEGDSIPWEIRKQSFIYTTAKSFNDLDMVKSALYNLIAENPYNASLYDSLAMIYYQKAQYVSAAIVAEQATKLNPQNMFTAEIAAVSFEAVGVKEKALGYYEKLYLNNSSINTLYKMAFLQMEVGRYAESNTSLDIIIGTPEAKENMIVFPTVNQKGQNVSLEVASYRIKAMIEEEKGNTEEAKAKYLEVLKMEPNFQVVQQQLRELTKKEEAE